MEHERTMEHTFLQSLFCQPIGWHWRLQGEIEKEALQEILCIYLREQTHRYLSAFLTPSTRVQLENFFAFCVAQYQDRPYHNLSHIAHLFEEFDTFLQQYPNDLSKIHQAAFALALLAHDVIYLQHDPVHSDEALSAKTLEEFFPTGKYYIFAPICALAQKLVLCTQHLDATQTEAADAALQTMVDLMRCIDLSILAQPKIPFEQYEELIAKEYSHIPWEEYRRGRLSALNTLLAHMPLFKHPAFLHYNARAEHNLQQSILALQQYSV